MLSLFSRKKGQQQQQQQQQSNLEKAAEQAREKTLGQILSDINVAGEFLDRAGFESVARVLDRGLAKWETVGGIRNPTVISRL
jgi:hypothetical protein